MAIVAVVAVAVSVGIIVRAGGVHGLTEKPHSVKAGGFTFDYSRAWRQMPSDRLPAKEVKSVEGAVVAGLCPRGSQPGTCEDGLDVTYMLFQEAQAFPNPASLEPQFDASFAKRFDGFEKIEGAVVAAADGTRYLRYEFTFDDDGVTKREIVAAYRADAQGVLVIAAGEATEFAEHRASIVRMLDGARQHQP